MVTFKKRLTITLLGVAAALGAWPLMELILIKQQLFPSYMIFNIVAGGLFGLILGAFFGTGEGIITKDNKRIFSGALTGALVGLTGGIIGFLIGQAALFITGNYLFASYKDFNTLGIPIARAIGWGFMGIFIGTIEGFRARSGKKIFVGFLGGLTGGLLGGITIEYLGKNFPHLPYTRLVGLVVFGALIGLFYSILEKRFSFGTLKLLNGSSRGKEFFINQNKLKIGSSSSCDITLEHYGLLERHLNLRARKEDVVISKAVEEAEVQVNEKPLQGNDEIHLKYEDVIKIGKAKFYYKHD